MLEEPCAPRRQLLRAGVTLFGLAVARASAGCGDSVPGAAAAKRDGARAEPATDARAPAPAARPNASSTVPAATTAPPANAAVDESMGSAPAKHLDCAQVTTFAPIVDDGPRASFLHTSQSSTADWLTIGVSMSMRLSALPNTVLGLLRGLSPLQLGYPLNMLAHSLQAATRARRAGAADDLVLAALCHRIGMVFTVEGYAELSAATLRGYVADGAYRVVRHHPEFSAFGGQPISAARYQQQPWHAEALRFTREWSEPSWDPGYEALTLEDFAPLLRAKLAGLHDPYATRTDCI